MNGNGHGNRKDHATTTTMTREDNEKCVNGETVNGGAVAMPKGGRHSTSSADNEKENNNVQPHGPSEAMNKMTTTMPTTSNNTASVPYAQIDFAKTIALSKVRKLWLC